jgi:glycine betaine/choline ABC-type transport system substrate-binding protein
MRPVNPRALEPARERVPDSIHVTILMGEHSRMFRRKLLMPICLGGLLGACSRPAPPLAVGSKTSVEQIFLAEVAARHLERKLGLKVARKFSWGETQAVHTALVGGEIDLYPEYGCVAVGAILRVELSTEREVILERARDEYKNQFRAIWMDPLGFDGRYQVAVLKSDAARFKVKKLSDLAGRKEGWRIGLTRDLRSRKDGMALLGARYRIPLRTPPVAMDPPMFARALAEDQIDVIVASATDAVWDRGDLRILEDDLQVISPCEASYVLRSDADQARPGVRAALAELSGKFTLAAVRAANLNLSGGRTSVEAAAENFLREVGLPR